VALNGAMADYLPKFDEKGQVRLRALGDADKVDEAIVTGRIYNNMQEAYNVGCQDKPECYLLSQNPYSDLDDETFFKPRRNPAKKEFQYVIEYEGTPK